MFIEQRYPCYPKYFSICLICHFYILLNMSLYCLPFSRLMYKNSFFHQSSIGDVLANTCKAFVEAVRYALHILSSPLRCILFKRTLIFRSGSTSCHIDNAYNIILDSHHLRFSFSRPWTSHIRHNFAESFD